MLIMFSFIGLVVLTVLIPFLLWSAYQQDLGITDKITPAPFVYTLKLCEDRFGNVIPVILYWFLIFFGIVFIVLNAFVFEPSFLGKVGLGFFLVGVVLLYVINRLIDIRIYTTFGFPIVGAILLSLTDFFGRIYYWYKVNSVK